MKTEMMLVTPKMAREWLSCNTDNRPLRPGVVAGFMKSHERGEWKVTHQGIAFGVSGRLLDGQHRLSFISELKDGAVVPMNVTTNMDDDTFDSIDQGFKRTTSDLYAVSSDLVAVARFFAKISNSTNNGAAGSNGSLTPQFVKPFIDWVAPEYELLLTFCPKKAPMWSTAPVRCAAIYNIKQGFDKNFVRLAYDALVHSSIAAMPPAVRLLAQQYLSGKVVSARNLDLFCRAQIAFDPSQQGLSRIQVRDVSKQMGEVRSFIRKEMKKTPDQAGGTVAKPAANVNWKKVA